MRVRRCSCRAAAVRASAAGRVAAGWLPLPTATAAPLPPLQQRMVISQQPFSLLPAHYSLMGHMAWQSRG